MISQVAIEAIRGNSFRGDIGLDDIRLTEGPCSKFHTSLCFHIFLLTGSVIPIGNLNDWQFSFCFNGTS